MRVVQQPGFVLHTRPWSESSLLVDLFSRDHGRLVVIAKGARRLKSPLRGVLAPFRPLLAGWSGKGELPTLTAAEAAGASLPLSGAALHCGFYLNELLLRLLHRHDAHERLFDAYQDALAGLGNGGAEWALRVFEKCLLREIGYALVLENEADGGAPVAAGARYRYDPGRGPVRLLEGRAAGVTVSGRTLLALAAERLDDDPVLMRECKWLMRGVLGHHLDGRPLRSREVARALRTLPSPDPAVVPDRGTEADHLQ